MGFFSFNQEIAIDLGTANTIILYNDKIVVDAPSMVALDNRTGKLKAVGHEAQAMYGRAPENIRVIRPLQNGVIADFNAAEQMMRGMMKMVSMRNTLFSSSLRMVVCIPSGSTEVEIRAVRDSSEHVGGRDVYMIYEPMAAAIGVGIDVEAPEGNMIVDIGGGTTEIAVISLGGIVTSSSLRLAGNRMDEAIAMHLRDLLGIKIGERTAEVIKIKIGSILPFEDGRERDMIISGQDVITEQPKEVTIQSEDVRQALIAPCEEMVVHIKETFKKTNPDLASDIIQNGILLTGGGGLLSGLDRYLTDKLEIPVWVSETALTNVVMGCLKVLETPQALKQTLMRSK